ncbi:TetR/AcrR family transcriptional regulator [Glaciihabitans sp. INWT7]|uniref:TetR/AcrR family transcriptional regulator n=1 Tax=Glaciihabitans sp. INWT7 TaxID=2596912 RepID=UPI001624CF44|nr:TetR/AcrR family transcriptional regulator [Glaciihabitans sp. INWT7]QNE46396.1 TetR/AcrR family transcriptional regulator [Glaciihabitans sp. INWT7]
MGRNRTFIEADIVAQCAEVFRSGGYEGTSIDDLVVATGLHRGSLYKAFGSKRGLFVLALRQSAGQAIPTNDATDLLLVALMELARRDPEIRAIAFDILSGRASEHTPQSLGERLLERALETLTEESTTKDPA